MLNQVRDVSASRPASPAHLQHWLLTGAAVCSRAQDQHRARQGLNKMPCWLLTAALRSRSRVQGTVLLPHLLLLLMLPLALP